VLSSRSLAGLAYVEGWDSDAAPLSREDSSKVLTAKVAYFRRAAEFECQLFYGVVCARWRSFPFVAFNNLVKPSNKGDDHFN